MVSPAALTLKNQTACLLAGVMMFEVWHGEIPSFSSPAFVKSGSQAAKFSGNKSLDTLLLAVEGWRPDCSFADGPFGAMPEPLVDIMVRKPSPAQKEDWKESCLIAIPHCVSCY